MSVKKRLVISVVGGSFAVAIVLLSIVAFQFLHTVPLRQLYESDRLNLASLYFERGNYYFGGGTYNIVKAQANFEVALGFENKANDPIRYQVGRVHFIKGDLHKALEEFDKQLEENPSFMRTYYMRGLTYGYVHEYEKAEADFKKFIDWKPTSWAAHNDLVWVYFLKGDYDSAEKYARKGLEAEPYNPWLSNALGAILLNTNRLDESIAYLTDAKHGFESIGVGGWAQAYPGNDPRIYSEGYTATIRSVEDNLAKASALLARGE